MIDTGDPLSIQMDPLPPHKLIMDVTMTHDRYG
jgi:hypothetical protein